MLESQAEIVDGVKLVVQGVLKKYGREYFLQKTREQVDTPELWSELGSQGLLGIGLPEEYGGSGKDMIASVAFVEAMSEGGVAPVAILANSFTRNRRTETCGSGLHRGRRVSGQIGHVENGVGKARSHRRDCLYFHRVSGSLSRVCH